MGLMSISEMPEIDPQKGIFFPVITPMDSTATAGGSTSETSLSYTNARVSIAGVEKLINKDYELVYSTMFAGVDMGTAYANYSIPALFGYDENETYYYRVIFYNTYTT